MLSTTNNRQSSTFNKTSKQTKALKKKAAKVMKE